MAKKVLFRLNKIYDMNKRGSPYGHNFCTLYNRSLLFHSSRVLQSRLLSYVTNITEGIQIFTEFNNIWQ